MPNPRFLKTAERWKNDEVPKEREKKDIINLGPASFNSENVQYSFLDGSYGKSVLEKYNKEVGKNYNDTNALRVLAFSDNLVKGSNPFAFTLLNKILKEDGAWVARPADLERALSEQAINLRDTYGDSALVLRSEGDLNGYLAKDLVQKINKKSNFQYPLMIPLIGLDLEYDNNSPHKLAFNLTDSTELIHTPQFENQNDGKKFDKADEKGRPIFDRNGSRTLYTGEGGLRRLYRSRDLYLVARNWDLDYSDGSGRVIVCREAARSKN